jgi:DNA-binding IclR family transcriptional regulator
MDTPSAPAQGAQTLARGLVALRTIAQEADGVGPNDLAERLGVHRSIAYRLLQTLVDSGFAVRGDDGRYRGSVGLLVLASGGLAGLRATVLPPMRSAAEELGATLSLLVAEGREASALAVVEPQRSRYRIAFAEGSTHPLDRGAAGHVLCAFRPAGDDDPEPVRLARERGWSQTFGEVEPGAFGLAVPLVLGDGPPMCLNLITHRHEIVESALDRMLATAREIVALAR